MMAKMQMNEQQYEKCDGTFQGVAIDHMGTITASEAWLQIGHSGYLQRKFELAAQWYVKTMRRGLNSTRAFIEAYSMAAVTFQRRRDYGTAMAVYERLFRAYPWLKPFFTLSLLGQLNLGLKISDLPLVMSNVDASFKLQKQEEGEE
jgi:tetratricopeptide (TPR) repeat protein